MKHRTLCLLAVSLLFAPRPAVSSCNPSVQWVWDGAVRSPSFAQVCITPLVVQLTDDNLDGTIDALDSPDVVFTHCGGGCVITAVDGLTGADHFTTDPPYVRLSGLAAGDLDDDGNPEIVLCNADGVQILDRMGNVLESTLPIAGFPHSQPVIADLDGDGSSEVVIISRQFLYAFEWTGTNLAEIWSQPHFDASGVDSAAAFDFDGNGSQDLVFHDEQYWYIFDGPTGTILSLVPLASGTWIETPVIADIDGDCKTEILVGSCFYQDRKLIAYECDSPIVARPLWNQYQYHVTNVNDDATIPQVETAPWKAQNTWLGQIAGNVAAVTNGPFEVCEGDTVLLDGSAALLCDPAEMEYRWLDGPVVICDWSPASQCQVSPSSMTTYRLEVRCVAGPSCPSVGSVSVSVSPSVTPDPGIPQEICEGDEVTLTGDATVDPGCPGGLEFRWLDGAVEVCPWSPSPSCLGSPAATTQYTLEARCAGSDCTAAAQHTVVVIECPTAVRFAWYRAERAASEQVDILWTTAMEADLLGFIVQAAPARDARPITLGFLAAHGPASVYTFRTGGPRAHLLWYRIVEQGTAGLGDATPFFRVPRSLERTRSGRSATRAGQVLNEDAKRNFPIDRQQPRKISRQRSAGSLGFPRTCLHRPMSAVTIVAGQKEKDSQPTGRRPFSIDR